MELRIFPEKLTQEELLKHNSEETYMEHYLGIPVKKGLFKSSLRKDNKLLQLKVKMVLRL